MPVVAMPNGDQVNFPDDMPKEQIKSLIAQKFPEIAAKKQPDFLRPEDKQVMARTGRILLSGAAAPADLLYAAGALPYNAVRGVQQAIGAQVAPELPASPGEQARAVYDKITNNAGQSQGMGKILDTAAEFVAQGAGMGGAAPQLAMRTGQDLAATAAAGAGTEAARQYVSDDPVTQMMAGIVAALATRGKRGEKPTPEIKAEKKVLERLGQGDIKPEDLQAGKPLIDTGGENIQRLGEAVANVPGKGAETATNFVKNRAASAGKRVKEDIAAYVSSGGDVNETADAIMQAGRARAKPLYEEAYQIDIIPDKQLKEIMSRPSMVQAAKNAQRIAADEGKDIRKLGTKTEFYDYVKRGLDDVLEGYRDKTTGRMVLDTQGRAIENLRKEYLDVIKKRNPLFDKALKESSSYFESKNALQNGVDFMDKTPNEWRKSLGGMSGTDRELVKVGLANKLRSMVDSANIGTDISKRVFGKQDIRDNLQAILEPREFGRLKQSLEMETEMHKLNQRIVGNSRTLLRKEEVDNLTQDPTELLNLVSSPGSFAMRKAKDFIFKHYNGLNQETSGEIAKILFEEDPIKQKQNILRLQRRAATGYKPGVRAFVLLQKIGDTSRIVPIQTINQGDKNEEN